MPLIGKGRLWTSELRAAWMHEFLDTHQVANIQMNQIGGAAVPIRGLDLGRDWANGGGGVQLVSRRGMQLMVGYDLQFNQNQTFQFATGGIDFRW